MYYLAQPGPFVLQVCMDPLTFEGFDPEFVHCACKLCYSSVMAMDTTWRCRRTFIAKQTYRRYNKSPTLQANCVCSGLTSYQLGNKRPLFAKTIHEH